MNVFIVSAAIIVALIFCFTRSQEIASAKGRMEMCHLFLFMETERFISSAQAIFSQIKKEVREKEASGLKREIQDLANLLDSQREKNVRKNALTIADNIKKDLLAIAAKNNIVLLAAALKGKDIFFEAGEVARTYKSFEEQAEKITGLIKLFNETIKKYNSFYRISSFASVPRLE